MKRMNGVQLFLTALSFASLCPLTITAGAQKKKPAPKPVAKPLEKK